MEEVSDMRILVVEDNKDILSNLLDYLSLNRGAATLSGEPPADCASEKL